MLSIMIWFNKLPNYLRGITKAIIVVIPIYFSTYLSTYISNTAFPNTDSMYITVAFLFVLTVIVVLIIKMLQDANYKLHLKDISRRNVIIYSQSLVGAYMSEAQELYREIEKNKNILEPKIQIEFSLKCIKQLIQNFYSTLESQYGQSEKLENRINFEVTFMTKSHIDQNITIIAASNRDNRFPYSMQKRTANPEIYNNTETANIYRSAHPEMRIVTDTSIESSYQETYTGQKKRIKSTIIYPVVCARNILLGTIVIHCDKAGFFMMEDERYWREVFEIFTKPIGMEKLKIDIISELTNTKIF